MVLILLAQTVGGAALAAGAVAHVSASWGPQFVLSQFQTLSDGALSRVEIGAGSAAVQGYVVGQFALFNAPAWYDNEFGTGVVVGDLRSTGVGAGVRFPLVFGRFSLVPHGDLGVDLLDSPMSAAAYQRDVVPEVGTFSAGPHAAGPWANVGAECGVVLVPDEVTAFLSPDFGYILVPGIGLTAGLRLGLAARF